MTDKWEQYRGSHEPEEHWELRKEFLKRNDDGRFSENRLLCLSRAFANMEFLGCKYPLETMEVIRELSMGIVEDYRAKKETRIQRTFVKASDAAERKTKGQNRPRDNQSKISSCDSTSSSTSDHQTVWPVQTSSMAEPSVLPFPRISPNNVALQSLSRLQKFSSSNSSYSKTTSDAKDMDVDKFHPDDVNVILNSTFEKLKIMSIAAVEILNNLDKATYTIVNKNALLKELNDFYVVEVNLDTNPVSILTQSFSMCHKNDKHKYEFPPYKLEEGYNCKCDMIFGTLKTKNFIVHGEGKVKKDAKKDVAEKALKLFRRIRPTIQVKDTPKRKVERSEIVPNSSGQRPCSNRMENNSVAMKMMLKMGWKGGGLGVLEDGISEPIDSATQHTRLGLGNDKSSEDRFQNTVAEFLREVQESLYESDIEFSAEFTKEERKTIHRLAEQYNFKSRSYGSDNNRHLVISRKVDPDQIFKEVMDAKGKSQKYTILLPDCLQGHGC